MQVAVVKKLRKPQSSSPRRKCERHIDSVEFVAASARLGKIGPVTRALPASGQNLTLGSLTVWPESTQAV
jgi:hypothetical protein